MVLYILGGNGEEEGVSLLRGLKYDIAFFLLSRTLEREAVNSEYYIGEDWKKRLIMGIWVKRIEMLL